MSTTRSTIQLIAGILIVFVFLAALTGAGGTAKAQIEMSEISGTLDAPRRHARLRQPSELNPAEAARVYDLIRGALQKGYGSSGFEGADTYQDLRRYNTAPYESAAHGNHYLNNYANDIAARYGEFERAGKLPVGSILFKDSFSVARSREIIIGPLFIMRKMEAGFNWVTGDWQYIQIQPDGEVLGMTKGKNAERVEYCIACHLAREQYDHLYFIPNDYR